MTRTGDQPAGDAWTRLSPAAQRSLELAHASLVAGGLAVGSALADSTGRVVAAGRNRAYDPPGGPDRLQRTPLAHAELNALAGVETGIDLGRYTLWSTQQPCTMCDAALVFTGVGTVCWLGPDPWARAAGVDESRPGDTLSRIGSADDRWIVVATVLFVASVARSSGTAHPTVQRNAELEPETALLLNQDDVIERLRNPFLATLNDLWNQIEAAATARRHRIEGR